MLEHKQLFTLGILIILINIPFGIDLSNVNESLEGQVIENVIDFNDGLHEDRSGSILPVPAASDWPPHKSDNPYRRVIVKLEREPLSIFKRDLKERMFDSGLFNERLLSHHEQLKQDHVRFKTQLQLLDLEHELLWDYYNAINGLALVVHERDVGMLSGIPGVVDVSYDSVGSGSISDTVGQIKADEVWQMKNGTGAFVNGEGVVIAVLDTGIDYNHKDLGGGIGTGKKIAGGYDFVNNDADPMDDNYHGTMVAGIIAADGTLTGVAPNATLLAYKVSDETDNAWISDTVAGLDRALDPDQTPATDDAADIICISLSWFGTPYDRISEAVDNAFKAGSLPVVAAGNNGPDIMTVRSPGTAYGALTVGAVTKQDELAVISSRGPVGLGHIKPELVAPGIEIYTTYLGNQYGYLTGSSAAGPHVVGAAALIKQLHPNWTVEQVRNALVNNAEDLGEPVVAQGAGRLDVKAAADTGVLCSPDILAFETDTGAIDSTTTEKVVLNNTGASQVNFNVGVTCYYSADEELLEVPTPEPVLNYIQPQSSSFSVPALSTYELEFQLDLPVSAKQGYYWGKIKLTSATDTITLPFGFRHLNLDQDKGEWVVSTDTVLSNQKLKVANLTVMNNAKLELTDVSLFINSVKDGVSRIDIQPGSALIMKRCTITGYNPHIYYNFSGSGVIDIAHSSMSGMWGIYESPYPGGINIKADGSEVSNTTVFRCYTNSIFIDTADRVLIADNYLHHNGGEGVLTWQSSNISILRNNCSSNWWDGVGVTYTHGIIADNDIHFNSYDGIWVNASSPYIVNNRVSHSGYWLKHQDAAGIKLQRNSTPVLENNIFTDNKYYGFYINASSPVVWNTSISNSQNQDIYMIPYDGEYSHPKFINSTYNSVLFQPWDFGSTITRQWFFSVSVTDETGTPVPGALVRIIDSDEAEAAAVVTDSHGYTPRVIITQYIRSYPQTDHKTPYRLEINKSSIAAYNYTGIVVSSSMSLSAVLPVPDLFIKRVSHSPDTVFVNEKTLFYAIIKNNGSFPIPDLKLSCFQDGNSTPFAEVGISSLGAGQEKNVSFMKGINVSGRVTLIFKLSTKTNLLERNFTNNRMLYDLMTFVRPKLLGLVIVESHTYLHEYITFEASADAGGDNISGYQFRFSDGSTTDWLHNGTHRRFFSVGTYMNVTYRVRTGSGLHSNWSGPLWFQLIARLPGSGIDIDPLHGGNVKTNYKFTPSIDLDAIDDIISSYSWTFGDGGFDDNRTPEHDFSDDGTYNITLKIRYSTDGTTFLFWKKLVVVNIAPAASFFASSTQLLLGQEVTFDASTTVDVDDPKEELDYHWDLGDGTESTGMVVKHTYVTDDTYFVTLTVTDDDFASTRFILEVKVTDPDKTDGTTEDGGFEGLTLALVIVGALVAILIVVVMILFYIRSKKTAEEEEELEE